MCPTRQVVERVGPSMLVNTQTGTVTVSFDLERTTLPFVTRAVFPATPMANRG